MVLAVFQRIADDLTTAFIPAEAAFQVPNVNNQATSKAVVRTPSPPLIHQSVPDNSRPFRSFQRIAIHTSYAHQNGTIPIHKSAASSQTSFNDSVFVLVIPLYASHQRLVANANFQTFPFAISMNFALHHADFKIHLASGDHVSILIRSACDIVLIFSAVSF